VKAVTAGRVTVGDAPSVLILQRNRESEETAMANRSLPVALQSVRNALVTLALLAVPFSPASIQKPASADEPIVRDHRDPDARLQIVLKQVHIFDDEDTFGEGEIHLLAIVTECLDAQCVWQCAVPNDYCTADGPIFSQALLNFGANSGDRVNLGDRLMPRSDDAVFAATRAALGVSDEAGIPVQAGKRYQFGVLGWENDAGPFDFDTLGYFSLDIEESNGWGVGSYTRPGVMNDDGKPGDFEMTFEVRRTPLSDLVPASIRGQLLDDGRPVVCATVANTGERESVPFQMVLRADGADVPGGTFGAPGLAVGEPFAHCFLVAAGQHRYALSVDESRQVAEMNESNNVLDQAIALRTVPLGENSLTGAAGVAPEGPASVQSPATTRPDLTVESIRVGGPGPSGTNDCDPGKNDVKVVVKNLGDAAAIGFAVRVVADNEDEMTEKTGLNLDAGTALEMRFDDLRLNKGGHRLAVKVDATNVIAESREDNNTREAGVTCKDEG
jgi:hypothetical protein